MSYIGSQPATNFETVRKQVSTTNSGTTITLDYSVSSVQDILVTVNAVVQSYDNYSVSGTTLTLGGTLNNDRVEILYVGRTFQTVVPAVGTVTNEMLSGSIANSKLANSSITLNGSSVSLGGSATVTPSVTPDNWQYFSLGSNTSQLSSATQSVITGWGTPSLNSRLLYNFGTQYTSVSSGIFSFSTEGYYKILFRASGSTHGATEYNSYLDTTTNNSSYGDAIDLNGYASTQAGFNFILEGIFKITDTSNHKVRFSVYPHSANMTFAGNTTRMRTYCRFERLGTTS
jgi:hypothetical protein